MSAIEGKTVEELLVQGIGEAHAWLHGRGNRNDYVVHSPPQVDVRDIRKSFRMTQKEFAAKFGFKVSAIRDWEQGRHRPTGHAAHYLTVIKKKPEAVLEALDVV